MFAAIVIAAALGAATPDTAVTNGTNVTARSERRRPRPAPVPREKLPPVEAWHRFCRADGKVEIPKDTRPAPYRREKPNPHRRKPRK